MLHCHTSKTCNVQNVCFFFSIQCGHTVSVVCFAYNLSPLTQDIIKIIVAETYLCQGPEGSV